MQLKAEKIASKLASDDLSVEKRVKLEKKLADLSLVDEPSEEEFAPDKVAKIASKLASEGLDEKKRVKLEDKFAKLADLSHSESNKSKVDKMKAKADKMTAKLASEGLDEKKRAKVAKKHEALLQRTQLLQEKCVRVASKTTRLADRARQLQGKIAETGTALQAEDLPEAKRAQLETKKQRLTDRLERILDRSSEAEEKPFKAEDKPSKPECETKDMKVSRVSAKFLAVTNALASKNLPAERQAKLAARQTKLGERLLKVSSKPPGSKAKALREVLANKARKLASVGLTEARRSALLTKVVSISKKIGAMRPKDKGPADSIQDVQAQIKRQIKSLRCSLQLVKDLKEKKKEKALQQRDGAM